MKKKILAAGALIVLTALICSREDDKNLLEPRETQKPKAQISAPAPPGAFKEERKPDKKSRVPDSAPSAGAEEKSSGKKTAKKSRSKGETERLSDFEKELMDNIDSAMEGEGEKLSPREKKIAREIAEDSEPEKSYVFRPQTSFVGIASRSERLRGGGKADGVTVFASYAFSPEWAARADLEVMKNLGTWRDFLEFKAQAARHSKYAALGAGIRADANEKGALLVSPFAEAKIYYWFESWLLEIYGLQNIPGFALRAKETGIRATRRGENRRDFFVEVERETVEFGKGKRKKETSSQLELGVQFGF